MIFNYSHFLYILCDYPFLQEVQTLSEVQVRQFGGQDTH